MGSVSHVCISDDYRLVSLDLDYFGSHYYSCSSGPGEMCAGAIAVRIAHYDTDA